MHAFAYSRIVAIGLGKFNSVLCVFDPATAAHAFASFASDRRTVHDRLDELDKANDRSDSRRRTHRRKCNGRPTSNNQLRPSAGDRRRIAKQRMSASRRTGE